MNHISPTKIHRMTRGILYIVWGDKIEDQLQRSIRSVKKFYPHIPIHVERLQNPSERPLLQKANMATFTPFESTLYLDADTVVLGNLDFAFDRAEEFGLACAICECPWSRRYDTAEGDNVEYNTGVLFFTAKSRSVFDAWQRLAPTTPSTGRWWAAKEGRLFTSSGDDQASFARAVRSSSFNPFVLPANFNFRPNFQQSFFTPLKIWHSPMEVPASIEEMSTAAETNQSPVTFAMLKWGSTKP
jgi:hypothetical protein